jgi:hypothetical protein
MMCGTAENRVLECRTTVAVCQNSRNKRILDACAWFFSIFCGIYVEFAKILLYPREIAVLLDFEYKRVCQI